MQSKPFLHIQNILKLAFYGLLFGMSMHLSFATQAPPLAEDPELESRVLLVAAELRCLVCQNESIADSHADLAIDLRNQIREQLKNGKTQQEIITYMVDRYGDFVLYRPPVKPITWLLWIGPFVILAIGIAVLLIYLRRRNTLASNKALTAEDNQKIDALLNTLGKNNRDGIHG